MSQLDKWMMAAKISKLVLVITSKDTGEHLERWQFDIQNSQKGSRKKGLKHTDDNENSIPESVFFVFL